MMNIGYYLHLEEAIVYHMMTISYFFFPGFSRDSLGIYMDHHPNLWQLRRENYDSVDGMEYTV